MAGYVLAAGVVALYVFRAATTGGWAQAVPIILSIPLVAEFNVITRGNAFAFDNVVLMVVMLGIVYLGCVLLDVITGGPRRRAFRVTARR